MDFNHSKLSPRAQMFMGKRTGNPKRCPYRPCRSMDCAEFGPAQCEFINDVSLDARLLTAREITDEYDIDLRTVTFWRARYADFPEPDTIINGEPVWLQASVKRWLESRRFVWRMARREKEDKQ